MRFMRVVAVLILALNLCACLAVLGSILYSALDIYRPRNAFLNFDFRIMAVVFTVPVAVISAAVGLLWSGIGLAVSMLRREVLGPLMWWVAPGLLYASQLLVVVGLMLLADQ